MMGLKRIENVKRQENQLAILIASLILAICCFCLYAADTSHESAAGMKQFVTKVMEGAKAYGSFITLFIVVITLVTGLLFAIFGGKKNKQLIPPDFGEKRRRGR